MNKREFLRRLEEELRLLNTEERNEILDFYKERFNSGIIYENKSEEEIINELESPNIIARNVLEEYGINPKYEKRHENTTTRTSGVSVSEIVVLAIVDLLFFSWLVPTLFAVVVAIFGSMLSYIGMFGFLTGDISSIDLILFILGTAGYIILFVIGLAILDLFIFVCRKILIWHLNVLRVKNREKFIKSTSKFSVDGFFKRHTSLKQLKNLLLIISIVAIATGSFYIYNNYDEISAHYNSGEVTTDVYTLDVTDDLLASEGWSISTDLDIMDITFIMTNNDEIKVSHEYSESENFVLEFDEENNLLTITENYNQFNYWLGFKDFLKFMGMTKNLVIEVPSDLVLQDLNLTIASGGLTIQDATINDLNVILTNGDILLSGLTISENLDVINTNGEIDVVDIVADLTSDLKVINVNGVITVSNTNFGDYDIENVNGSIYVSEINTEFQDGNSIEVVAVNGTLYLDNVYVSTITLETVNGSINYYNDDDSFLPDLFEKDVTNGDVNTNVR